MPRIIDIADDCVITLDECVDALAASGFRPDEEESLLHGASLLRRLGNDRTFLGDRLVQELAQGYRHESSENSYGPQVIMLAPPGAGDSFIRANIWPSESEHALRASGGSSFVYGLPHDHNFHFLTLGYFGPGYWSDYYEYDYGSVTGWSGELADLRFTEKSRLEEGKIMHYRAHRDVHRQLAADELSVSLNIMHAGVGAAWYDQYAFDTDAGTITRILNHGASEAFIRVAVGLGGDEAKDLAHHFGRHHPSSRLRLHAWGALASIAADDAARDAVWARAELCGDRMVSREANMRRTAL